MDRKTIHVRITGKVQGVFYRAWTQDTANRLGLSGWVKNCPDSSVEAIFSGSNTEIDQILKLCRIGPEAAKVENIEILEENAECEEGFRILS